MNRLFYTIIAPLLLLFSIQSPAQERGEEGVTIHADARLSVLLKKTHTMPPPERSAIATPASDEKAVKAIPPPFVHRDRRIIYTGKGYRVQIYYGPDRVKAAKIKAEFMRHFPGIHTYLSYSSPSFRVKVGDYRNRSDAQGMMKEANSMYSPCMIVPDNITVSAY